MNSPNASDILTKAPLILIVDDDEDNRVLIAQQLMELYHHCSLLSAASGQSAIDLAHSYQPDLILLDIMLPDLDGIEVVQRLRQEQQKKIPIVAVTALARQEERNRILAAGCDDYITKPYDLEVLEQVICRQLNLLCCLS
jgi:two-component system, cell cycle response regulator DivK